MSVVRVRRKNGEVVQWCQVYIGRKCTMGGWDIREDSKWANPFTVKEYGRDEALKKYEQYVRECPNLWNSLEELDGKILGCWCLCEKGQEISNQEKKDKEICHGQVLLRLLKEKQQK